MSLVTLVRFVTKDDVTLCFTIMMVLVILILMSNVLSNTSLGRSSEVNKRALDFVKQSMKWKAISQQDKNPIYALIHNSLAMAYLESARHLLSDDALHKLSKANVHALKGSIGKQQEQIIESVNKRCPRMTPRNTVMSSWME